MAFPTRLQQLLDEGRVAIRSGVRFEFGTGTYGIWNGKGDFTYNGLVYLANHLIQVDEPPDGLGTAAAPIKIKMPASADFGVTPDRLKLIDQEDYKNRPVYFYDFYFDPDDRAFLHAEPRNFGYVDTIQHLENAPEIWLEANIETAALDNHREGYRTASHEDQQLVSAGDQFFEYAARVKNEFFDIKF